jgi:monooxygenase
MADHVDVLIVGAGLSGISAACHLERELPGKTYAILEARERMGGTWDLFRYPGVRSDSDMFTLGFSFKPWADGQALADGPSILRYIQATAEEFGVDEHIRYEHRVVRASWSTPDARWTVEVERTDTGETTEMTAGFLFTATGYYRYDEGFTPELPGVERFGGQLIHPQHWPEDLDYAGKRVVVIGSGATAVTLVPAMAPEAGHVTMLQRSPSYIMSVPNEDPVAGALQKVLPAKVAHRLTRWKNIGFGTGVYQLSQRAPKLMRKVLEGGVAKALPAGFDVDQHFTPSYDPWDQRLCFVPDGDLFEAIGSGKADVVTDKIATFTETGIELESGTVLEADIVITATGLNMLVLGGIELEVDGEAVDVPQTLSYRGCMLEGVPNYALCIGYTNLSWTLKCELICQYVVRLLQHMDERGYAQATPRAGTGVRAEKDFLTNLSSGYIQRAIARFPKQSSAEPWQVHQNYLKDVKLLRRAPVGQAMEFRSGGRRSDAVALEPELEHA